MFMFLFIYIQKYEFIVLFLVQFVCEEFFFVFVYIFIVVFLYLVYLLFLQFFCWNVVGYVCDVFVNKCKLIEYDYDFYFFVYGYFYDLFDKCIYCGWGYDRMNRYNFYDWRVVFFL